MSTIILANVIDGDEFWERVALAEFDVDELTAFRSRLGRGSRFGRWLRELTTEIEVRQAPEKVAPAFVWMPLALDLGEK